MSKINFKDYSDNYIEIKMEDAKKARELEKQEKLEDKKNLYELNLETKQKCLELKEYLEVLKNSANSNSIDKEEISTSILEKLESINDLRNELLSENDTIGICRGHLSEIYIQFGIILAMTLLFSLIMSLFMPGVIDMIFSLIAMVGFDFWALDNGNPCIHKIFKIIIGSLPFNNRYSFVKIIRKLERLENEYEKFSNQYEDYLSYLENPEKSEVAENIIKTKEVKDLYLLEINKLVDKVKDLPLGEDREKYLVVLEKLTELYKREKERIILKNGRVHSEEETQLGMSVLKQLAYIEMQINSSIYKNKNVNLLSEDYITTLGKIILTNICSW